MGGNQLVFIYREWILVATFASENQHQMGLPEFIRCSKLTAYGASLYTVFTQVLELDSGHLIQILINGDKLRVGGGTEACFKLGREENIIQFWSCASTWCLVCTTCAWCLLCMLSVDILTC